VEFRSGEDESDYMFGDIIRRAREQKGLSLADAAHRVGLPKTTFWRLESGQSRVSAQQFVDIAAGLGFSVAEALEGNLVTAPSHTDFDRLGQVVEHIEGLIQRDGTRPTPSQVRTAVVEVLRLETARVIETPGATFEPARYNGLVTEIFRNRS
jgi:transcriptional regulator with XRE-family HTH domain